MAKKKKRSKQPSQVPPLDERHYTAMDLAMRTYYDAEFGRNRWFTREEIAEIIGISRMQLYRWEQRKDFQREKSKRIRAEYKNRMANRATYAELAMKGDIGALQTLFKALQG